MTLGKSALNSRSVMLSYRHLPKCFDNMHNLEFRKSETGENTKAAIGMYSGENEFVAFTTVCVCDGPVEVWLQVSQLIYDDASTSPWWLPFNTLLQINEETLIKLLCAYLSGPAESSRCNAFCTGSRNEGRNLHIRNKTTSPVDI